jgi:hypothetical protein
MKEKSFITLTPGVIGDEAVRLRRHVVVVVFGSPLLRLARRRRSATLHRRHQGGVDETAVKVGRRHGLLHQRGVLQDL